MDYISLLWPQEETVYSSKTNKLSTSTINSLDLNGLCKSIAVDKEQSEIIKEILISLCCDLDVIRYRQDIFSDFISSEKLIESIEDLLRQLEQLRYMNKVASIPEEADLWKLFSRFSELAAYTDCVTKIGQTLQNNDFQSKGLNNLRDTVMTISEGQEFKALSEIINNLSIEINEIQSISLGINLDSSLNPSEVTLISVNKTKYKDNSWVRNLSSRKKVILAELGFISKLHGLSQDRRQPIMYNLYKDIESLLKPVVKDLSSSLKRFTHIRADFLVKLIPEMTFYLSCARLFKHIKENGMPFCKPEIAGIEERKCIVKNAYNINLALHMLKQRENPEKEIVLNDIYFDESGRILILTGPNRGGKTVYTEAIGLEQVLFQAGVFIPGTYAYISPVDSIFVHFPVDENQTTKLGRLGEESKRLNDIFNSATRYSLILLNESLVSTSFTEGLYIAQDVIKSLRYLETRALFNTHMHELATYADSINNEVTGDSKVVSLVTGLIEGRRSYKVQPGIPLGKSYARDIAIKYGVSFEQIIMEIDKRKHTSPS